MKIRMNAFSINSEEEMEKIGIKKILVDTHHVQQENGWMSMYTETSYRVYCKGGVFIFSDYLHFFGYGITFPAQDVKWEGDENSLAKIKKEGKLVFEYTQ